MESDLAQLERKSPDTKQFPSRDDKDVWYAANVLDSLFLRTDQSRFVLLINFWGEEQSSLAIIPESQWRRFCQKRRRIPLGGGFAVVSGNFTPRLVNLVPARWAEAFSSHKTLIPLWRCLWDSNEQTWRHLLYCSRSRFAKIFELTRQLSQQSKSICGISFSRPIDPIQFWHLSQLDW